MNDIIPVCSQFWLHQIDSDMSDQINSLSKSCHFHIRDICGIQRFYIEYLWPFSIISSKAHVLKCKLWQLLNGGARRDDCGATGVYLGPQPFSWMAKSLSIWKFKRRQLAIASTCLMLATPMHQMLHKWRESTYLENFNPQKLHLVSCSILHSRQNMADGHTNKHRFDYWKYKNWCNDVNWNGELLEIE